MGTSAHLLCICVKETERKKMHEELEKETIRSSVLRHQLRTLPGQIRDEIMGQYIKFTV